jgi:hypothetical protein
MSIPTIEKPPKRYPGQRSEFSHAKAKGALKETGINDQQKRQRKSVDKLLL